MEKKYTAVLIFVWLFILGLPLSAEEITIGYRELPVLIEVKTNAENPVGTLVDYWVAMAKKMEVSLKWVGPLPSKRIILYLKHNKLDIGYISSKNRARAEIIAYPEKPVFTRQTAICLRKKSNITKIEHWSDLENMNKIGVVHGYRGSIKIANRYPALNLAMLKQENSIEFSLSLVKEGKLDAFIFPDKMNIMSYIKKMSMEDSIKVLDAPEPPILYYALFAQGRLDLLKKYNKHHDEVKFFPDY